ncbi:hypothetical protein A5746_10845 [Mycolicibacterium conceptionense]|uniref:hypothetical protein n=1 Tax=Mycolicibacterium conceptionense TaxID=451644 RepID=UPI0007ED87EE|nr:hypothetical protein [Mycolicibacterium conceptionense]OBK04706.1 hypothetical protein A5639_20765 [Mycolicibacterium conceptionense]OMB90315.1 hypothetical protein A5741_12090 [Mycolicibacterium conceptionense]OMC01765.1 hypothetical protein A5746_10845 [Mycolicibacterium conceptionense]
MATGRAGNTGDIAPVEDAQPAVSDENRARAEAAAAAPKSDSGGKFVLYTGPRTAAANAEELKNRPTRLGEGTYAEITVQQWAEVGIHADRTLVWKLQNNFRVPASSLTDAQLDYLLTNSKRFELVDADGNKVDR